MTNLADQECVSCRGGVPPLTSKEIAPLLAQLEGWTCVEDHHLERRYVLDGFVEALELVNRVGAIAQAQDHHPNLALGWGWAKVSIWTHKIDGLTESDFVFAAKCDVAYAQVDG